LAASISTQRRFEIDARARAPSVDAVDALFVLRAAS
jgi:hypothetical protein